MGEMYDIAESNAIKEMAMASIKKTYADWRECGFHVCRGERSCDRDEHGRPVFSRLQVEEDEHSPTEGKAGRG